MYSFCLFHNDPFIFFFLSLLLKILLQISQLLVEPGTSNVVCM